MRPRVGNSRTRWLRRRKARVSGRKQARRPC